MQYETVLGLRRKHTFDEVRRYIQADPTIIKFPKRDALFLRQSHLYGQIGANMRSYEAGVKDQTRYRASDEQAPYVPPKPQPPRLPRDMPGDPDVRMEPDRMDDQMTDQITGSNPPPPAPPSGLSHMIQGLAPLLLDSPPRESHPRSPLLQ